MTLCDTSVLLSLRDDALSSWRKALARLICLACILLFSQSATALTASEVFRRASPSVVVVLVLDSTGETVGHGSGVVVAKDRVITNCHVTHKARSLIVLRGSLRTKARVVDQESSQDLCMLATTTGDAPVVRLRSSDGLEIGEPVFAIGAPLGLDNTLSPGLISGLRDVAGQRIVQTNAPISLGSSGGGLFDDAGFLVGITVGYLKEGQNLNFAIPVDWIVEALQREDRRVAMQAEREAVERRRSLETKERELRVAEQAQRERMAQLEQEREAVRKREQEIQARERQLKETERRLAERETRDQTRQSPEQEARLEREAEARRVAILDEQQKLAAVARERAAVEAKQRREAEEAAARARELEAWKTRIHDRIKSKLILPPGVPDSARAEYNMTIVPGGEVLAVKLRRTSGFPAYDAAIERAINAAAPLPVPGDPELFQRLRELNIVFTPGPSDMAQPEIVELDAIRLQPWSRAVTQEELAEAELVVAEHIRRYLSPYAGLGKAIFAKYRVRVFTDSGLFFSAVATESSGSVEFDSASEKALRVAEPLPLPASTALRRELRDQLIVLGSDGSVQVTALPEVPAVAAPTATAPAVTAAAPAPPVRAAAPRQTGEDDGEVIKGFGLSISTRVGRLVAEKGHDRVYPTEARQRKWQGVTQVSVEYGMGEAKRAWVAKSSGYAPLDQRAIDLVQEVLPKMTPPPALRKRSQFTVTLPIVFSLQDK